MTADEGEFQKRQLDTDRFCKNDKIVIRNFLMWLSKVDFVNIAKGTTDPRVKFCLPKFKQVQTQILIKFHLQDLDQALTSKSQPNIISTKLTIQNIDQS